MSDAQKYPLLDQIREVGREIGLRKSVYKKFVASGRMTQNDSDELIGKMEAAYQTLKWVEKRQGMIRDIHALETVAPELRETIPLVLYFNNDADRADFVNTVREAKPGMIARSIPEYST